LEKETIQSAVDTMLEKGVDFRVTVDRPNLLHRLGLLQTEKIFVIYPIKLCAVLEISRRLQDMEGEKVNMEDGQDILRAGIDSIVKNHNVLIDVLAIAIHNQKGKPPGSLRRFLDANLTTQEALRLLALVVQQMSISDFLACMVSIKRVDMMGAGSTSGESSGESLNTSGSPGTKSSTNEA